MPGREKEDGRSRTFHGVNPFVSSIACLRCVSTWRIRHGWSHNVSDFTSGHLEKEKRTKETTVTEERKNEREKLERKWGEKGWKRWKRWRTKEQRPRGQILLRYFVNALEGWWSARLQCDTKKILCLYGQKINHENLLCLPSSGSFAKFHLRKISSSERATKLLKRAW